MQHLFRLSVHTYVLSDNAELTVDSISMIPVMSVGREAASLTQYWAGGGGVAMKY